MPEILEVETGALRCIEARATATAQIARCDAPDAWFLKRGLTPHARARRAAPASRFTAARRRGKLMLVDTDDGPVLGLHLGMSGRVLIDGEAAGDPLALREQPATTGVAALRRALRRRRHRCTCATRAASARSELDPDEDRLGPDAFDAHPRAARARSRHASRAPIKAVLMDQSRIAGLGNLLSDEALWRAGIDPARVRPTTLDDDETRRARTGRSATTLRVLGRRGGSHTGDLTRRADPAAHCPRDGAPLLRRTVGGRTTYSCPVHQH